MGKDPLLAAMRALQEKVNGITGTAVASRDGLIVRADTGGVDPDNLAALAATWLSLAQRMSSEAGQGTLREAMTRSSGGAVTIYAVGNQAVLVLIGDEGLDTARLRRESQATLDTIKALLTDAALGERHLAEQLVDPPQVPQPRFGAAAYPAADGLHRDAKLARRGLDREAFPAQHPGHPFGERRGRVLVLAGRRRGGRPGVHGGGHRARLAGPEQRGKRVQPGRAVELRAGAEHIHLDVVGEDPERDADRPGGTGRLQQRLGDGLADLAGVFLR